MDNILASHNVMELIFGERDSLPSDEINRLVAMSLVATQALVEATDLSQYDDEFLANLLLPLNAAAAILVGDGEKKDFDCLVAVNRMYLYHMSPITSDQKDQLRNLMEEHNDRYHVA